ncbi:MAG: D-Ala-D-Ala carboxypeptidase family metallohydrolase [bacterium]
MHIHLARTFLLIGFSILSFHVLKAQKLSYSYSLNGNETQLSIMSWFAMPGDTLRIEFSGKTDGQITAEYSEGVILKDSRLKWRYIVPKEVGIYVVSALKEANGEKLTLNVFVKRPAAQQKGEYLNGYRIGTYPQKPYRNNPMYLPPKGFIEVTRSNLNTRVSPHFLLGQFLCKQQPDQWPKYLLLNMRLLMKLEMITEELKRRGLPDELFVMSGYRTPYYNHSIGQGKYSRHIYGDAVDIYVDENKDGVIDDLNRDGKASMGDADVIYRIVENIEKEPANKLLIGGIGKYRKTSTHTWDVHVDTRGFKARW